MHFIRLLAVFAGCVCAGISINAQKHDYVWLYGYGSNPNDSIYGGTRLDFNVSPPSLTYDYREWDFTGQYAMISDTAGELQFYSNGCNIISWNNEIMENGDTINPGWAFDNNCEDTDGLGVGKSFILPIPYTNNQYLLFHSDIRLVSLDFPPYIFAYIPHFYYSLIDMTYNDGQGKVILKNIALVSDTLNFSDFTAVKHSNNNDWWIFAFKEYSNKIFRWQITEDGINYYGYQYIGLPTTSRGAGQAIFSPDGTRLARYDPYDGLYLYDFDRGSGIFSDFRHIHLVDTTLLFGSCAFSPNGRYIYMSTTLDLFQLDLMEEDSLSAITHIDTFDGFLGPNFPTLFLNMQLGPDCKIYISAGNSTKYIHVIHQPNLLGKECDFEQHGILLPRLNFNVNPYFPNYRLGTAPVCDSTISVSTDRIYHFSDQEQFSIFPNPGYDLINIQFQGEIKKSSSLLIFNALGQQLEQIKVDPWIKEYVWDPDPGFQGLYFIIYESNGMVLQKGKGVIVKD